jgi:hypothetical protein
MNPNYQQIQHALDILLIGLPSAFFATAALDLIEQLIGLWHSCSTLATTNDTATLTSTCAEVWNEAFASLPDKREEEDFQTSLSDVNPYPVMFEPTQLEDATVAPTSILDRTKKELCYIKTEYSPAIDFTTLSLRQCRAIIKEINKELPRTERIRQKVNRKDQPLSWLRSQIKKRLEQEPINTSLVISSVLKAS